MKDFSTAWYALTSALLSVVVQTSAVVSTNQRQAVQREIAKTVKEKLRDTSDSFKGISCNCRNYCPDPNSSELEVSDNAISCGGFTMEGN